MTSSNGNIFRVSGHLCGEFPTQRPVTRSFDVFFDLRLNNGWVNNGEAGDLRHYRAHYDVTLIVHGPEQISVPSGWAKLGNVFREHICPVHYLSHDRPLNSAAFMWLLPMLIILFPKNNIFVFFNKFQMIFKLKPSSMTVLIEYNCNNTSWYPFRLYLFISLKKSSNRDKFMRKFLPFHNQWKIWTASLHSILKL